jgi:CRP-like cAMP-binding protein
VEFVSKLEAEQRKQFDRVAHETRVRKGHIVIGQGSRTSDVFFIKSGQFQVLIFSNNGREVSIRTLERGDLFGELAALDTGTRSANVVALSDGLLVQMSGADFRRFVESSPATALWLARRFAAQIRVLTERIFELSALDVRSRLHCELLRLGLLAGVTGNRAKIVPAPTHYELANRIGTHREAVTRELRALAKRGVLSQVRRELVILNFAELSRLVQRANGEHVGIVPAPRSNADLPIAISARV